MKQKIVALILVLGFFISSCQSTQINEGKSGWENVTLHATGFGPIGKDWSISERIHAVQNAKMDAYVKLQADIMALQIGSKTKVAELVEEDKTLQKKITAFIRGAKIIRTENRETGVNIVMELFLGGNFKATIGLGQKRPIASSNSQRGDSNTR